MDTFFTRSGLEKKYGVENITYFLSSDTDHRFFEKDPRRKVVVHDSSALVPVAALAELNREDYGYGYHSIIFTGIHNETDWTETRQWYRGISNANASGDYAVVWARTVQSPHNKISMRKSVGSKKRTSTGIGGTR